jgi:hypothetical protein
VSTTSITPERMVIAIDPHKASWTAAVVDASQQPVATIESQSAATATVRCDASPTGGPIRPGRSKVHPAWVRR